MGIDLELPVYTMYNFSKITEICSRTRGIYLYVLCIDVAIVASIYSCKHELFYITRYPVMLMCES